MAGLVLLILASAIGVLLRPFDSSELAVFRASTDQIVAVNSMAVRVSYTVVNTSRNTEIPVCVVNANGPTGDYSDPTLGTTALAPGASVHATVSIIIINGGARQFALSDTTIHCEPATR